MQLFRVTACVRVVLVRADGSCFFGGVRAPSGRREDGTAVWVICIEGASRTHTGDGVVIAHVLIEAVTTRSRDI